MEVTALQVNLHAGYQRSRGGHEAHANATADHLRERVQSDHPTFRVERQKGPGLLLRDKHTHTARFILEFAHSLITNAAEVICCVSSLAVTITEVTDVRRLFY